MTPVGTAPASGATKLTALAPQFLVDDLDRAIEYYIRALGFSLDFKYDDFYASVSRDGCAIHLKEAPKTVADRAHRKANEHLDASIATSDATAIYEELKSRGALIAQPLQERPWACRDFYVEDPDGYILCFSEVLAVRS